MSVFVGTCLTIQLAFSSLFARVIALFDAFARRIYASAFARDSSSALIVCEYPSSPLRKPIVSSAGLRKCYISVYICSL